MAEISLYRQALLSTTPHNLVPESPVRHPREGGEPGLQKTALDYRLRGNDVQVKWSPCFVDVY
jgi:hypothetical protein